MALQTAEILENAEKILSIEYVSVVGLLLVFCAYLIWINKKLKEENKEKDGAIMGFIEKYYVISTEIKQVNTTLADKLERMIEVFNRK